jgi:hypothetical protein
MTGIPRAPRARLLMPVIVGVMMSLAVTSD